jgi:L,D-peptidoglycan transpeptidase YkuD (ErfK/YbiS/YcfS/YnhG family)
LSVKFLRVCVINQSLTHGRIVVGARSFLCHLGCNGLTHRKREGDGKTPIGQFRLMGLMVRRDRLAHVRTGLPQFQIGVSDGWCDVPYHPAYNHKVRLPFRASHERLWREDELYDALVILDYNLAPRKRNSGSAIFFHLSKVDTVHTQGCVSVSRTDMIKILTVTGRRTRMMIGG